MVRNDLSGSSGISPLEYTREHYRNVMILNVAGTFVNAILLAVLFSWYRRSFVALDSSFDHIGLISIPIFIYFSLLLLPICGIWMWMCYARTHYSRRHFLVPLTITTFQITFFLTAILLLLQVVLQ